MTKGRKTGGRVRFNGCCGLCGIQETSRWYRKKIENKVICKSCYDKVKLENSEYKEHRYLNRSRWGATFKGAKNSAKRSGYEWTLTEEQWKAKTQNCHYCWIEIKDKTGTKLDRVDSNLPYSDENTVGCCKTCNVAKNNMTLTEFKQWLMRIYYRFAKNKF